ncbi:MAG: hypothetical protein IKP86_01020 [Anaerolineaceae bacterium]|nr:hypothetical protein [Anaerolineaceae bacterium]
MTRRDIVKLAMILAILVFAVVLAGRIGNTQQHAESDLVRQSIKDAAINCYAVEGAYPDSLDYLRENYMLAYNEDRYFVTYQSFSSNHIPDIYVTERGAQ